MTLPAGCVRASPSSALGLVWREAQREGISLLARPFPWEASVSRGIKMIFPVTCFAADSGLEHRSHYTASSNITPWFRMKREDEYCL